MIGFLSRDIPEGLGRVVFTLKASNFGKTGLLIEQRQKRLPFLPATSITAFAEISTTKQSVTALNSRAARTLGPNTHSSPKCSAGWIDYNAQMESPIHFVVFHFGTSKQPFHQNKHGCSFITLPK